MEREIRRLMCWIQATYQFYSADDTEAESSNMNLFKHCERKEQKCTVIKEREE